ncbi:unnamed protein product [Didymodactylos carnosus]|uniref:Peptide transporter n=1 Tax=Didymodactylos carnosus TaxID=1234261 RepID=A0A813XEQ3_9BILA|nr:unnamed protein product [Didymodactylos carnosus]CAF1139760.1 unnamed protein product [Didymodactylos carnosus]CAF3661925.1 unnamed protein product [Didymodactylos carnosus]CAF3932902.1 unnamed protein product [Didymodactylos carnosus]
MPKLNMSSHMVDVEMIDTLEHQKKDLNTEMDAAAVEIEPTTEQMLTLERISDKIPLAAWLIVLCEFCERFSYYGLSSPFQNYIEFPVPTGNQTQPGVLDEGQATATGLTNFFQFFCYITPIMAAIIADQFWGKYKTIVVFCFVYMFGLLVLVLSAIPPSIARGIALPGLIIAMIIIGLGTGGIKSNVSPLTAEQYTRTKPIIKEIKGKMKIIDPDITIQSIFNWFYWAINLGSLSAIITTSIEKHHSFWLAYLIPLIIFIGTIVVIIAGRNKYIKKPPTGSLLLKAFHSIHTAFRIRYKYGKDSRTQHILDYAKPSIAQKSGQEKFKWDEEFINDLKQAVFACRVFVFYPFYWICYNQLTGNLISQAAQMNVHGLPNDILINIDPIVLVIFIPIFDKIIYPTLRKYKCQFSYILRITFGFYTAAIAMAWTAIVQNQIYITGPNFNYAPSPCAECQAFNNVNVAWQVPSYFFIAISEIFASITGLEYAFAKAPASMKSIIMSIFLFTSAIGSALSIALIPVTKNPKLLWMYTSLAVVACIVGTIFYICFRNDDKEIITKKHDDKEIIAEKDDDKETTPKKHDDELTV